MFSATPPVIPPANGSIWIESGINPTTVIDPNTGNITISSSLNEIPVSLTRDKEDEKFNRQAGSKTEILSVRGYILSTQTIIRVLSAKCKATFTDGEGVTRTGALDFQLVVTPFTSYLRDTIGVPIRGIFEMQE